MSKHTLTAFVCGAIQLQDMRDKTKPLRQMRCTLARIHLSFEGVIFLIWGVSGALRQMRTWS